VSCILVCSLISWTRRFTDKFSFLDISPNNILVEASADVIAKVEGEEIANPSPRKVLEDRVIHLSCIMPTSWKEPVITDFGAAYLGEPDQRYHGDIMPGVYRAPEIIAGMEWDAKVDIWAMGVMVGSRIYISTACRLCSIMLI
jgi:serine/threonine protein kinase